MILCPANRSPLEQIHTVEKGHHIIHFSREQCGGCPLVGKCPVQERKKFYSLGFSERQALLARRRQQMGKEEYQEKCRLRAAIEGTVSQFKQRMHNGKLRVRGHKKVRNVIIAMAIAINFERIWAYMRANGLDLGLFSFLAILLLMLLSGTLGRARIWGNLTTHWASVG